MLMGVPMLPMVILSGASFLLFMWGMGLGHPIFSLIVLTIYVPVVFYLRLISVNDEYQLQQLIDRFVIRIKQNTGVVTFSPIAYDKR